MRKKFLKKTAVLAMAVMMLGSVVSVHAEGNYTTKSGDSLSKIAKETYGDAGKWNVIYEANKDQIKDPNKIWANQILIMPGAESAATESTEQTTEETTGTTTTTPDMPTDTSAFLQNVYNLMAAQDYVGMRALVESVVASNVTLTLTDDDRAVYIPDGSLTGMGTGLYIWGAGYMSFYYGDYVNGERNGNGTQYIAYSSYTEIFTGTWNNDAPNGPGTESTFYDDGGTLVLSGSLVNGLWNGAVNVTRTRSGKQYNDSFMADNGVVPDRTEELLSHLDGFTREDVVEGNRIIYAFYGDVEAIENGVEQYDSESVGIYKYDYSSGERLGVTGWAD